MNITSRNEFMLAPKVTIIIPTYNRKELLSEAVDSCLEQTWENIEVIIVDDGSIDGTPDLVAEKLQSSWSKKRINYIWQQNAGASAARNHGFQHATGDYVQFLDSDDILFSDKVRKQLNVLNMEGNSETACCYCYGCMGSEPYNETKGFHEIIGYHSTNPKNLLVEMCSRTVHSMSTPAPLWRSSFLKKHSGWREDISLGDDLEFHVRLLADADEICFINEKLFFVREHSCSRLSTDQMSEASLSSIIRTRQAVFYTLQESDLWNEQIQSAFLCAMRTIYANTLQFGNSEKIRDLEVWLQNLSSSSGKINEFQVLILLRRMLGRNVLLGAHKLISKLRGN